MKYIYQNPDWHNFMWHGEKIQKLLLDIKKAQGYLLGRMDSLGFDVKNNALLQVLTENIIKSSEIEGQILDKHIVRSSIARRLGIKTSSPFSFRYALNKGVFKNSAS